MKNKKITKTMMLERLEKLRAACSTHDFEDYGPSCPECPCGDCETELIAIRDIIKSSGKILFINTKNGKRAERWSAAARFKTVIAIAKAKGE